MSDYIMALTAGLGSSTPGALAIVRQGVEYGERDPVTWMHSRTPYLEVISLERLDGCMSTPEIAARIEAHLRVAPLTRNTELVVDSSVGRPPSDYLRARRMGQTHVRSVLPVSGDSPVTRESGMDRIPVKGLISNFKIETEKPGAFRVQRLELAAELMEQAGALAFDQPWRVNGGEELVAAAILACWYGTRPRASFGAGGFW